MREIKFKYYFLLNKVVVNTKIFIMEDIEDINFNTILFLNVDCNKDNFENMELYRSEYTGLKDKNDVEIYEGDIVRDGSRLWKIEISPIYGIFFILSKGGHTRCYGDFASYLVDEFEVIGNIYKNKELLA